MDSRRRELARLVGVIVRANLGIPGCPMAIGRELEPEWGEGVHTGGITPGHPAPEVLVEDVIDALRRLGLVEATLPDHETTKLRLPTELAAA